MEILEVIEERAWNQEWCGVMRVRYHDDLGRDVEDFLLWALSRRGKKNKCTLACKTSASLPSVVSDNLRSIVDVLVSRYLT